MATVEFKAVDKFYDEKLILKNINFRINPGEFIVIVGPSGCGKSTLLRLVAGLETTTKGNILINSQCVSHTPPAKRDIAMVFQNYALYPHMTVFNNIAYSLKITGIHQQEIKDRVLKIAQLLKLTDYLYKKPGQLSGGQCQRVAMGRAIIRSPSVFLFDEPLCNLDTNLRNEMRWEIKKLHQNFRTTSLYVTHDQTEAMTLADRIVILNNGHVEQIDTPENIYMFPASLFVAGFMGHYSMNFIEAEVDLENKILETNLGIKIPLPPMDTNLQNKTVLIGIRPEHLSIDFSDSDCNLPVKIEFVENFGSDKMLHVRTEKGNIALKMRLSSPFVSIDDSLQIKLDYKKMSIFCPKTGKRIGARHG